MCYILYIHVVVDFCSVLGRRTIVSGDDDGDDVELIDEILSGDDSHQSVESILDKFNRLGGKWPFRDENTHCPVIITRDVDYRNSIDAGNSS